MRYATAAAFRTALEQRLLATARQSDVPLVRLRKLVAFERLLARLLVVAPDRWILKGAVALHLRLGMHFRTTRDMDLGRWDDERTATDDLVAAERVDLGDHFRFAVERTARLNHLLEGAAVRYHVSAYLAGRRFEGLTVDVGFGDPLTVEPERLRGPDLLSFAEIQATEVPTLPLEPHVAEKVHAYTRSYAGGRASTRVKDLIDLALIPTLFPFQAGRLQNALRETFDARGTHPVPSALPPPPAEWRAGYRRMAAEVGLDTELSVGYDEARAFLDPVLAGTISDDANWDPARWTW
ncbi:MAG: nucleotidyl transferase AbiEii/AbiGii toxin family protein [Dehalococcoidia bacterium]